MILSKRRTVKRHSGRLLHIATILLAFSCYCAQVACIPIEVSNEWPTFPRRNIAALARGGYLPYRGSFKRSISVLAKNGQLPTFRAPYDPNDGQEQEGDSHEKRNLASIARLRSYADVKRNIQTLARDGYISSRGQKNSHNDKRNIGTLARDGMLHKRDELNGDEYFYPFYQNSIPPLSEIDGPFDANEIYDYQQSVNPDMFPPLSQVFKRDTIPTSDYQELADIDYLKRTNVGLPAFGLYRPVYVESNPRNKRYVITMPDVVDQNDIHADEDLTDADKRSVDEEEVRDNFEKRHIGSLARLGLLPSFRFSGGRYSRSGRARLLWPSQELYRKHSPNENFGIREYFNGPQADAAAYTDDSDIPSSTISSHSHPTGRILHGPLSNDLPINNPLPSPPQPPPNSVDVFTKNHWQPYSKETPKFFYFRSLKVPYHQSGKRYLVIPAVDNILLRKNYPNSSLPSRRKNQ